ncbi:MAG: Ig-like domain repeat protein [Acidimicrobiales bacterium]
MVAIALFGGLLTFVGTTPAGAAANGTVSLSPPSISAVGGSTTVTVTLGSGEGSPTDNVTVSITSGGGTATAANGDATASVYTATITAGDIAGTYMVSAVDNTTGTEIITSASLTEVPGSADKLVFTIEPSSSATSNKAFGTQPAVTVEDLDGNVVTGSPTSVTLALATPNGATLSCNANPVTTDNAGVATFAGCAVDLTGTFTLMAAATGLSSAVSTSFTVGGATSVTFLPSSPVTAGSNVTYTVSVAEVSGSGTLTGSVSFVVNSVATSGCTNVALSSGIATCTLTFASPGSDTVTAIYSGDPLFAASSASLTQVVAGATRVIVKASSPRKISVGTTVTYKVSVAEVTGFGSLTGSVSYEVGSSALSGCTDLALSTETPRPTCTITFDFLGRYKVTATYANDPIFASSSASVVQVVVARVVPNETDTVRPLLVAFGSQASLRIHLYGRRGLVSGKIKVKFGGTAICTATLVRGRANCAVDSSKLGHGKNTLVVVYNGHGLYLPSSRSVVVNVN